MQGVVSLWFAIIAIACATFPVIRTEGDPHKVGFETGLRFAQEINNYITQTQVRENLIPFVNGPAKNFYQELLATNQGLFPDYFKEIQGIADGAKLPFQEIAVINLWEIGQLYQRQHKSESLLSDKGCTDVMVNPDTYPFSPLMGHNEDMGLQSAAKYCWMTSILHNKTGGNNFWLNSFQYPGVVPGNSFGWNSHGLVITINYLYPDALVPTGASTPLLCHSLLHSSSIKDLLSRIQKSASGVNLNVLSLYEQRLVNVEIGGGSFSVTEIHGNFSHVNRYKILNTPQQTAFSSIHRAERINQYAAPATRKDILTILGDTSDTRGYPIYRDGAAPDDSTTVATFFCDADKMEAEIFWSNPGFANAPSDKYPLDQRLQ